MTLDVSPAAMTRLRRARFWALALVALLVAHDAVYLAAYGSRYPEAMAATGHGYWSGFTLLVGIAGVTGLALAALTLLRLRALLAGEGPGSRHRTPSSGPGYLAELVSLWPRLALATVGLFLLQENAESLLAGHGAPGLGVLDGPLTLQALLAVAGLLAAAGAFLRWRERVLVARLAAARAAAAARHPRPAAAAAPPAWGAIAAIVAHGWILARRLAGRAPPVGIAHRPRGPRPVTIPT